MSAGRCGLCGNRFGQLAEELVHADCIEDVNKRYDRLRERLDQFDAYGMPNVAAALDRIESVESALAEAVGVLRFEARCPACGETDCDLHHVLGLAEADKTVIIRKSVQSARAFLARLDGGKP